MQESTRCGVTQRVPSPFHRTPNDDDAPAHAPDILDGVYAIAKVCSPFGVYSHSLPAIAVIAAITMVLAYAGTRSRAVAIVFGLVVLAHVPADWVTGEKVLWLHGPVIGLSLYRWPAVDFVLELPLIVGGWWMLRRMRGARRWAVSGAAYAPR